jgi:hypothetical protein
VDASSALRRPTHDYTILPGAAALGQLAITMLVPEGLPARPALFLIIATLWWQAVTDEKRSAPPLRPEPSPAPAPRPSHAFAVAMAIGAALAPLFPTSRLVARWVSS